MPNHQKVCLVAGLGVLGNGTSHRLPRLRRTAVRALYTIHASHFNELVSKISRSLFSEYESKMNLSGALRGIYSRVIIERPVSPTRTLVLLARGTS